MPSRSHDAIIAAVTPARASLLISFSIDNKHAQHFSKGPGSSPPVRASPDASRPALLNPSFGSANVNSRFPSGPVWNIDDGWRAGRRHRTADSGYRHTDGLD